MSKFIEKLKQLSEGAPQPIGFRPREAASARPKIQLVIMAGDGTPTEAMKAADSVVVTASSTAAAVKMLKVMAKGTGSILGARIEADGDMDAQKLAEAGADFIVFGPNVPLAGLLEEKIGKIIEVDSFLSDWMLRSLNAMPVDAVLVSHHKKEGAVVTFEDLLVFQRLGAVLNKPLLIPVPGIISEKELSTLWEAGVDGVVVPAEAGQDAEAVVKIRDIISRLPYPSNKSKEKTSPIAPRVSLKEPEPEEEEEEDDE